MSLTAAELEELAKAGVTLDHVAVFARIMERRDASRTITVTEAQQAAVRAKAMAAERAKKYRLTKKSHTVDVPPQPTVTVTPPERDASQHEKSPVYISPSPLVTQYSEGSSEVVTRDSLGRFPEFWAAYPKRAGSNSRKEAEARYQKIVARGVNPIDITAGALRYAAFCNSEGLTQTKFVQQATTWLNREEWTNDYAPSRKQQPELMDAFDRLDARIAAGGGGGADRTGGGVPAGWFDDIDPGY